MATGEEPSSFNSVIEQIRNTGYFQRRFNYTFNFALVIMTVMPYMNLVLSVATPDHWCHVPGRENTNYTLEEWKNMTIPMEVDSKGGLSYSRCKRFATNITADHTSEHFQSTAVNVAIVKCDHGWDYDRTWYDRTASTQNDWVCDDAMVPANAIALGRIGEVIGMLIFGQLGDNFGRMPVFFITLTTLICGRIMSAFTSSWVYAFWLSSIIGFLPSTSMFQSPLVIGMEISRPEDRALVSMLMCYGWNLGSMVMPLVMWWFRDWVPFLLATTLPCAVFFFSKPWMIESPRWLASKGKITRCMQVLRKVASANSTEVPDNAEPLLRDCHACHGQGQHHTVLSLFSSLRLAKNTIVLVSCWTTLLIIYFSLTVDVSNLGGNPFLNYLFQAMVQMPGYSLAKFISNRYGRRWVTFTSFLATSCGCIPIMFLINDSKNFMLISALCIFLKFSISLGLYAVNLQKVEIYPTCVRQTGIATDVVVASAFGVLSPYIIALGVTTNAMLPYMIYGILALTAAILCTFLPETHGYQLPESLADAAKFGADQDMWGRSKRRKVLLQNAAEAPLNATIQ